MTTETFYSNDNINLPQDKISAYVEALFPAGNDIPAPDPQELTQAGIYLLSQSNQKSKWVFRFFRFLLGMMELRCFMTTGRSFASLSLPKRQQLIDAWSAKLIIGSLLRVFSLPFKVAYLQKPELLNRINVRGRIDVPSQQEKQRWHQQIISGEQLEADETLEVDAVVVGSGAGGAVAAYELASRGLAVVILEEGSFYDRQDFTGDLLEVVPKLYRAAGATGSIGNCVIPIPTGKNVGGTTTINSGTAMRPLSSLFNRWRDNGLWQFTAEKLDPYFQRVERDICVETADLKHVGPIADVIRTGAEKLGFKLLHALPRNAEGCDGQGLCQFGCPTGAKKSTNFSYIPKALDAGAFLYTDLKAETILRQGKKIVGIQAVSSTGKKLTLKAEANVLAMGAFQTPLFLRKNKFNNPWIGKNLSLHPSGAVTAYFENIDFQNSKKIPQGFGVADWAEDGIMFEGGTPPFLAHGMLSPHSGTDFVEHIERFQHTAYFGVMISDTSRGSVVSTPIDGYPLIIYNLNKVDFEKMLKGMKALALMYLKAGAKEVTVAGIRGFPSMKSETEIDAFFRKKIRPLDLLITAYHPLGTARIAANPNDGVCDSDHKVYGYDGLYVMDGSSVPSALGANPQLTIMTMAARAAEGLAEKLAT